jgi:hypothetical protein
MNQAIKKIISVLLLVVFLSGSGAGQLVHSIFHKHPVFDSVHSSVSVSSPRTFCSALQLMLPDFCGSINSGVVATRMEAHHYFAQLQASILHFFIPQTCDRAPPVLA